MLERGMGIVLGCVLLITLAAQALSADEPPGARLFATYCQACHGVAGQGGFAPAIGAAPYLNAHGDAEIGQVTGEGVLSKGMPAWGKSKGGALTDAQIQDIVAYLRSAGSVSLSLAAPAATVQAPAASLDFAPTKMTVTQSTDSDGHIVVRAELQSNGASVNGVPIAFERVTSFGHIDLGIAKTDKSGIASLVIGELPEAARQVDVNFKGDSNLGSSAGRIVLESPAVASVPLAVDVRGVRLSVGPSPLLPPEGSLITPNPPLLPSALFLSVVGFIWAIYGFVISQVAGIWTSRERPRENTLSRKGR